jgi:hypothetical protein
MNLSTSLRLLGGLALVTALAGALTLVACPLSHDGYETDRPCWTQVDCVSDELCGKYDACTVGLCPSPDNSTGFCAKSSDGPCGLLDAGIPGYYCFPDENGTARTCYYNPEDTCIECALDGGRPSDCPDLSCVAWRGRYGCIGADAGI